MMPKLYTGDVIACWGTDTVSRVISLFTSSIVPPWQMCWSPSHVAIICNEGEVLGERADGAPTKPLWYESTTMVDGRAGVQVNYPEERWRTYGERCIILRPTIVLDGEQRDRLGSELKSMLTQGVPYDMAGALLSGTRFLRYLAPASGERLFCSELVARVLMVTGLMNWSSPSSYSPGRLCRELLKSGAFQQVRHAQADG